MWLSGQQKRPAVSGEGQTGIVTMGGTETAVQLDCERRKLEVYSPAGYRWTPEPGQRVLVIKGEGEIPAVVGVHGGGSPGSAGIEARRVAISGGNVGISAQNSASIRGERVDLAGQVYVKDEKLEEMIARIVKMVLAGQM